MIRKMTTNIHGLCLFLCHNLGIWTKFEECVLWVPVKCAGMQHTKMSLEQILYF